MKDKFIRIYQENIRRRGADRLLAWLNSTDFFTAPASTRFHLSREGGLCEHSVHVYNRLSSLFCSEAGNEPDYCETHMESLAICGLLHDVCKANFYKVSTKNVKDDKTGKWEKAPFYQVEDQFPYGHGEKSAYLIEQHMRLRPEEAMAIRWHMGGYDDSVKGGSYACGTAFGKYPLAVLLHIADLQATYLDENKEEN